VFFWGAPRGGGLYMLAGGMLVLLVVNAHSATTHTLTTSRTGSRTDTESVWSAYGGASPDWGGTL